MQARHSLLLSTFHEVFSLFTQYSLRPARYWRSIEDAENPVIQDALEKALELFDDGLVDIKLNAKLTDLIHFFCKDKVGEEKNRCVKRIKMLIALEDYITLHQEDILDPGLWQKSPITAKYPEVHALLDEDRLFDVANGHVLDDERLQYKADVFFYHPSLTHHFLREFVNFCYRERECDKKIALDPRRLLPARRYPMRLLEDYWFGPKFNLDDIDGRIHGIELTVHTRLPDSYLNMLPGKLNRTEFMWSMRGDLKTLQIEELVPLNDTELARRIAVRYIHTIRDTVNHAFVHLDGAIRWYSPENYIFRFDTKLSNRPNPDGYYKLFRVDGNITNQDWIDLIANFFSGNELIHEYFGQPMKELGAG